MKITFMKLAEYMKKNQTHVRVAGRTTGYTIPNSMGEGQHIMMTKKRTEDEVGDVEMDEDGLMGIMEVDDPMVAHRGSTVYHMVPFPEQLHCAV
jgi:hypothetical protein